MPHLHHVVFDLDGTLVDTAADIALAANRALTSFGLAPLDEACIRGLVGNGATRLMAGCLAACGGEQSAPLDQLVAAFVAAYAKDPVVRSRPYRGMAEVLDRLRGQGLGLSVLTNKPETLARQVLDHLGLSAFFAQIVGAGTGLPLKPDPTGLRGVVAAAGCPPDKTALVGDSTVDWHTAVGAGTRFVGAAWGFTQPDELRRAGITPLVAWPLALLDDLHAAPLAAAPRVGRQHRG